mgnify:CR=1 FL=1
MSEHLTLQIDPRRQTLYIYLRPVGPGGVCRTEKLHDGVLADFDSAGDLVGVEVLGEKAVQALFSLLDKEARLAPLNELAGKGDILRRLIA